MHMVARPWVHIRTYPPEEVTACAAEEAPEAGGLERADVEAIWDSVVRLYKTGLHPAIALCVRRRGRVVVDRSIGHVRGNSPLDPPTAQPVVATPASLFNLFSASKAITAMAVHLLDERGSIHLDDPVAEYLPEFGRHGKEWVTLRHILTHRAGIPQVPGAAVEPSLLADPKRVIELLCEARPTSVPGRRLAYHALSGGYVIGAVVERVTGRDIRRFLREEVLEPLGFGHLNYGVAPEEVDQVAVNAFTGTEPFPPYSWLLKRSLGVDIHEAVTLSNHPRFLTTIVPSGNVIATANEACRFFQILLDGGVADYVRVFDRRTVQRAVAEQSFLEVDSFLGVPVRYGMGFMLGSRYLSLYGHDTPRAFGHVGFTTVIAWADPERQVSAALMTSGKPFITAGQLAWLQVARTIAGRSPKTG
jgi:CubicO group peptidase (beta-lactamase class C family)